MSIVKKMLYNQEQTVSLVFSNSTSYLFLTLWSIASANTHFFAKEVNSLLFIPILFTLQSPLA